MRITSFKRLFTMFGGFATGVAHLLALVHIPEFSLLGKIASLLETFLFLGGQMLLAGNNAIPLVHHEMTLG